MKTFKTTNGMTVRVSDKDYQWVTRHKWYAKPGGYIFRKSGRRMIYLHREILKAAKGETVDHADRNPLNNVRRNLRRATSSFNRANSRKMLRNGKARSLFKGVTRIGGKRRKKPFQVYVCKDGMPKYLGVFATELEAAASYDHEARRLFGRYACTNAMLRAAA